MRRFAPDLQPPRGVRFSRVIVAAQGPLLFAQGRRLRRETPRLPDAPPPWSGRVEPGRLTDPARASRPLHLLVLGDSTAAGVGVDHADLGLGGRLADALAQRTGRPVVWRAAGANGATSRDIVRGHLTEALAGPTDIVFLTIGANDALAVRSARAFRRDVRRIVKRTFHAHPQTTLLMSSLPAFFRFQLLPEPLRGSLYRHSQALEGAARALIDAHPRAHMSPPPPPYTQGFFASDEFHPSAIGYRDWAAFAIDDAWGAGLERLLDADEPAQPPGLDSRP